MEPNKDCSASYLAHQQAIVDTQKRLEKLESNFEGMPQELQFIKVNVEKMGVNMEKLIDRLDTKFVTREMFKSVNDNTDKDIKELKETNKKLIYGLISALLIACKDILLHFIGK